jgi:hypothetical protein
MVVLYVLWWLCCKCCDGCSCMICDNCACMCWNYCDGFACMICDDCACMCCDGFVVCVVMFVLYVLWWLCGVCCDGLRKQIICYRGLRRGIDQSVLRLATGWTGIECQCEGDLSHTSRPSLGPTQIPLQRVPDFPGGNAAEACCYYPPPSSAEVMNEYSYISTPLLGLRGLL